MTIGPNLRDGRAAGQAGAATPRQRRLCWHQDIRCGFTLFDIAQTSAACRHKLAPFHAHFSKVRNEAPFRDATRGNEEIWEVVAGRSAYRDEYDCDHGPDRDEPLDGNESGPG